MEETGAQRCDWARLSTPRSSAGPVLGVLWTIPLRPRPGIAARLASATSPPKNTYRISKSSASPGLVLPRIEFMRGWPLACRVFRSDEQETSLPFRMKTSERSLNRSRRRSNRISSIRSSVQRGHEAAAFREDHHRKLGRGDRTFRRWRLCPLWSREGRDRSLHAVSGAGSRAALST